MLIRYACRSAQYVRSTGRLVVNKTVRRATLILALAPLLSLPATAAFAGVTVPTPATPTAPKTTTTTTTPAPGASASASAAQVTGIVTVGGTNTGANGGGG